MHTHHARQFSRRRFLGGVTLGGAVGLLGWPPRRAAAEPPPETTTIRLVFRSSNICTASLHLTEELLYGEGFTEVQYLNKLTTVEQRQAVAAGEADLTQNFLAPTLRHIEAGDPIVLLAGAHVGCLELFGTARVRTIRDLKGKTVAVPDLGGTAHVFLSSVAAYVGLDPRQDITWVTHLHAEAARRLVEGQIDALLAPPRSADTPGAADRACAPQHHEDRPWSQYFCCMVTGNREFVRQYPVATKRALRALFKSVDLCAHEPDLFGPVSGGEGLHQTLRRRPPGPAGDPVWQVAGVRPRGRRPLLRPPPPRGRHAQVEPAKDHRPGHGLAFPQGAQEGVEGLGEEVSVEQAGAHRVPAIPRTERALEATGHSAGFFPVWVSVPVARASA